MKQKKQRPPLDAEKAQRGGAAIANTTRGRKTTFTDRKREANRKACRKWSREE